ncbi:hypothetical protein F5141DRAFT_472373 [Pisolithus sp. B1]|nr:hypothetical protein F5141DRAFT_472373 [Pisolithus sp. B1]
MYLRNTLSVVCPASCFVVSAPLLTLTYARRSCEISPIGVTILLYGVNAHMFFPPTIYTPGFNEKKKTRLSQVSLVRSSLRMRD